MSASGLPDPHSPSGQGDIQHQTPHDEGNQSEVQATPASDVKSPADNQDALQTETKMESPSESRGAVAESSSPAPTPHAPEPTKQETLPGRMKGLSISTGTSHQASPSVSEAPPPPPEKDEAYLNPNSQPGMPPQSPTKASSEWTEKELPDVPGKGNDEKGAKKAESGQEDDSQPEIQHIMEQFRDSLHGDGQEQIMSPRLELAEQFLSGATHFPPRHSSLDQHKSSAESAQSSDAAQAASHSPEKQHPSISKNLPKSPPADEVSTRRSSTSTVPPLPEPEPDQPFDFHRFLEQLRHRTADPVAKFLRSFLHEFGKRPWMVHEQVKIISDFLTFITNKMALCEVWRHTSDSEFDNAKEGMEKLVMNRLYSQTFSPAIPGPPSIPRSASRSKRREMERLHGPWRRGQHQEDIERDDVLAQKMRIYSWVKEEHLDIQPVRASGHRFLNLAQQELLKINGYRAPRDKVICILNCCKVIFGLLRNTKKGDTSADSFIPLLIYVVLKANPQHLVSNIQYILRFRNQDKLTGEAGYYLSSLSGAISFIEGLDRTSLTVGDEEFERNVEAAVSAIAEQNRESESLERKPSSRSTETSQPPSRASTEAPRGRKGAPQSSEEDNAPVAGLLRTIQKPLTTIGKIFSDEPDSPEERPTQPVAPAQSGAARLNPNVYQPPRSSGEEPRGGNAAQARNIDVQDTVARQASAEDAEARRIQRAEHINVVETLSNMFPNLDRDVIDDVVKMKEGRVGLAVDACLALSAE